MKHELALLVSIVMMFVFLGMYIRSRMLSRRMHLERILGMGRVVEEREPRFTLRFNFGRKAADADEIEESQIAFIRRLQEDAWQAGLAITAQNIVMGMVVGAVIGFVVLFILAQSWLIALLGAILGLFVPRWYVQRQKQIRIRQIEKDLPNALRMWASAMRSGISVQESLAMILHEIPDPLQSELDRGYRAMTLGASAERAMRFVATRIGQDDFNLVVTSLEIHNQLGGDLTEQLETTSKTIEERIEARQSAMAKTAQARVGSYIIMSMPFGFLMFMQIFNHNYISALTSSASGLMVMGVAGALIGVAYLISKKIVDIPFI